MASQKRFGCNSYRFLRCAFHSNVIHTKRVRMLFMLPEKREKDQDVRIVPAEAY